MVCRTDESREGVDDVKLRKKELLSDSDTSSGNVCALGLVVRCRLLLMAAKWTRRHHKLGQKEIIPDRPGVGQGRGRVSFVSTESLQQFFHKR